MRFKVMWRKPDESPHEKLVISTEGRNLPCAFELLQLDFSQQIVGWAGFICPPFECLQVIPAWADKACPPYEIIILSINTSRLAARLFIHPLCPSGCALVCRTGSV